MNHVTDAIGRLIPVPSRKSAGMKTVLGDGPFAKPVTSTRLMMQDVVWLGGMLLSDWQKSIVRMGDKRT